LQQSHRQRVCEQSVASKRRLLWKHVPPTVKAIVEQLAGHRVVTAANSKGGFSPGLASRLTLADGRMIFVKAIDIGAWPDQAAMYRAEASVSARLPADIPAPRLLASLDDGHWVILSSNTSPVPSPICAADQRTRSGLLPDSKSSPMPQVTPSPIAAPSDHPRLGGWADLADDRDRLARLPALSPWAAEHLTEADRA